MDPDHVMFTIPQEKKMLDPAWKKCTYAFCRKLCGSPMEGCLGLGTGLWASSVTQCSDRQAATLMRGHPPDRVSEASLSQGPFRSWVLASIPHSPRPNPFHFPENCLHFLWHFLKFDIKPMMPALCSSGLSTSGKEGEQEMKRERKREEERSQNREEDSGKESSLCGKKVM